MRHLRQICRSEKLVEATSGYPQETDSGAMLYSQSRPTYAAINGAATFAKISALASHGMSQCATRSIYLANQSSQTDQPDPQLEPHF